MLGLDPGWWLGGLGCSGLVFGVYDIPVGLGVGSVKFFCAVCRSPSNGRRGSRTRPMRQACSVLMGQMMVAPAATARSKAASGSSMVRIMRTVPPLSFFLYL